MTSSISETNWCIFKWPYDMTHLNQPLTLALNDYCKSYYEKHIHGMIQQRPYKWCEQDVSVQHANDKCYQNLVCCMIIEFHNQMSQPDSKKVTCNGYLHASISGFINKGHGKLPSFTETNSQGRVDRLIAQIEYTKLNYLALSWRRPLSYRNQSIDLQSKSVDWFLYDNRLRHERVKSRLCYWKLFAKKIR